jgi:hypothetical protein
LNVDSAIILQLVRSQPHLALLSNDSSTVFPKAERDAIAETIRGLLSYGIISKSEFTSMNDLDSRSLDLLLEDQDEQLIYYDDHLCTQAYDEKLKDECLDIISRMISNNT